MALIWALSSMRLSGLSLDELPLKDKGLHFLEYGALGFLLAHATLRTWTRRSPVRTLGVAILITVAWGVLDEIHQAFVPGRSADILDLVADTLGAVVGAWGRFLLGRAARRARATESAPVE